MNNPDLNTLCDRILITLRRRPTHRFPLKSLAQRHKCPERMVVSAVESLRRSGYRIIKTRRGEYRFVAAPDRLLAPEVTWGLKTSQIGKTVYAYKSVRSTNSVAAQLAEAKVPEGTIVVAESQKKGRGRLGRSWFSPEAKGIYLSIILYPDINPAEAPGLSLVTAVALADTISGFTGLDIDVKWPNDCLIGGRKVAGILTELSADVGHVNHVIIGVGINANHRRRDFPLYLAPMATSLRAETRKQVRRVELLQQFLARFEKLYQRFRKSGLKGMRKQILQYSDVVIGKQVSLDMSGLVITGVAVDIDTNGNLILETAAGRRAFNAGEVTLQKQ